MNDSILIADSSELTEVPDWELRLAKAEKEKLEKMRESTRAFFEAIREYEKERWETISRKLVK